MSTKIHRNSRTSRVDPAAVCAAADHVATPLLTPERRLLLALLDDAITCYRRRVSRHDADGHRMRREAESWIFDAPAPAPAPRTRRSPVQPAGFSFRYVCDELGVSEAAVRAELRGRRPPDERESNRTSAYPPRIRPLGIVESHPG